MAQTRTYKKTMNFVYGMGAAIVIIGALFKIQHFNLNVFGLFEISGGLMLTIGLIVEAIVFAISAFDTPEDDLDWSKVYPELGDASLTSEKEEDTQIKLKKPSQHNSSQLKSNQLKTAQLNSTQINSTQNN